VRLGAGFAGEAFKEGIGFLENFFYHGSLFHFNETRICADERRWILSPPLSAEPLRRKGGCRDRTLI
jgi:hypothetical protein